MDGRPTHGRSARRFSVAGKGLTFYINTSDTRLARPQRLWCFVCAGFTAVVCRGGSAAQRWAVERGEAAAFVAAIAREGDEAAESGTREEADGESSALTGLSSPRTPPTARAASRSRSSRPRPISTTRGPTTTAAARSGPSRSQHRARTRHPRLSARGSEPAGSEAAGPYPRGRAPPEHNELARATAEGVNSARASGVVASVPARPLGAVPYVLP